MRAPNRRNAIHQRHRRHHYATGNDASRTNDTRRAQIRTPTIDGDLRHRPPLHKTSKISIEGDSAPTEQAHRQRVVMGTPARGPMAAEEQDEMKISSPHHQHPNLKNQADIVGHSRRHPTSIRTAKQAPPYRQTKSVSRAKKPATPKTASSCGNKRGVVTPGSRDLPDTEQE